jgi:hypothetical protein
MQPSFATVVSRHDLILPQSTHQNVQRAVRAASGLAWFQGRLGLVQDDTTAIVWLNELGRVVEEQSLEVTGPAQHFDATLGNKHLKPDLEAAVSFVWKQTEYWLALGSGSSDLRNRAVLLTAPSNGASGAVEARWLNLHRWYDTLRATKEFSGITLNIEAVLVLDQCFYLFKRGNGKSSEAVNAFAQFDLAEVCAYLQDPQLGPVPELHGVSRCDLGVINGVPWGFADACVLGQRQYFLLSAEDSIDAIEDGALAGTALAYCDHGKFDSLQIGAIQDADGNPVRIKLEGLSALNSNTLIAVSDEDDPRRPAQCLILRLSNEP